MQKFINVILDLFDGEGGGEGTSGEGTSTQAAVGDTGENVLYGIQPDEVAPDNEADAEPEGEEKPLTLEERRKVYNDFINTEGFKEFYTEDTQKMINRRFKETKNLEKQIADFQPILSMLAQIYGADDVNGIKQAIENDNTLWENKAYEAGMDVENFKRFQKLERENRDLHELQEQQEFNARVESKMQEWADQAMFTKQIYPEFDFEAEQQNPKFKDLLLKQVDVKTAYELCHHDEMVRAAMNYQEHKVTDNIRAKGSRPLENGTSRQGAFLVKSDVNALTREDRAEIARRARRGDVISF